MSAYIIRRMLTAIPLLVAISIIGFIIIQLPEGDFLDRKIQQLEEQYGDSAHWLKWTNFDSATDWINPSGHVISFG